MIETEDIGDVNHDSAMKMLVDLILPADGSEMISASAAIDCGLDLETKLDNLADWTRALAESLARLPESERVAALQAVELGEPEQFERLLRVVYAAFYGAPAVIARLERLAASLPRTPSPWFDPSALTLVVGERRGMRRSA